MHRKSSGGNNGQNMTDSMENQHAALKTGKVHNLNTTDCLKEIKTLLKAERYRAAFDLIEDALTESPDDPFLLSYKGFLIARLYKKHREGVDICKSSIKVLGPTMPFGQEFFLPLLYLNLGRAYFEAGNKHEAIMSFQKGLSMDPNNREITWEMEKLGIRRPLIFPFLERSNPLNKYFGKVRHKILK